MVRKLHDSILMRFSCVQGVLTFILVAATVQCDGSELRISVDAIRVPEYPPAREVPYLPPPPPEYRFEPGRKLLPYYFCSCRCGYIIQAADLSLPHPPVQLLAMAFRGASSMEVWRLSRGISAETMMQLRRYRLTYRDAAILGFARATEVQEMARLFLATADVITQDDDDPIELDDGKVRPLEPDEVVRQLHFNPDLVITFASTYPARVEFDWAEHLALVRVPGEWGFVSITRRAVAELRAIAESIPPPTSDPRIIPTDVFAGPTEKTSDLVP